MATTMNTSVLSTSAVARLSKQINLSNEGPNKFILLNNNGIAQHRDYITVEQWPTTGSQCGKDMYFDESGTCDELTFTPVNDRRGSRVLTEACHLSSGQIFFLEVVTSPSGVKAFLMHCGENDIAHFERADFHPEPVYDGELYTNDGVWVSELVPILEF